MISYEENGMSVKERAFPAILELCKTHKNIQFSLRLIKT